MSYKYTRWYLIKDVVVSFRLGLEDETRSLEQVGLDLGTHNVALLVKLDLDVFTKSRRVVISGGFCVTKSFHNRIGG